MRYILSLSRYYLCTGKQLAFNISDKVAFTLSLEQVANSKIASRTEVSLEFAASLKSKIKASDAGSQKSDDEDEEEQSAAQVFHDVVEEKAEH